MHEFISVQKTLSNSEDAKEGVQSFIEKRDATSSPENDFVKTTLMKFPKGQPKWDALHPYASLTPDARTTMPWPTLA
jgi:hypothetical protein